MSWTASENKPWPCRWALMMRTTTQTLSRLAHWRPAGRHAHRANWRNVLCLRLCGTSQSSGEIELVWDKSVDSVCPQCSVFDSNLLYSFLMCVFISEKIISVFLLLKFFGGCLMMLIHFGFSGLTVKILNSVNISTCVILLHPFAWV